MKKILYIILALIVLYFVLALFGPKHVKVERSIVVNAPAETVKEKLGDFQYFQTRWSPWTEKDPAMTTNYSGAPGEPGHKLAWSGNKDVGTGEMELVGFHNDSLIQVLRFEGQGESQSYYIIKDEGGNTKVTWGIGFEVG